MRSGRANDSALSRSPGICAESQQLAAKAVRPQASVPGAFRLRGRGTHVLTTQARQTQARQIQARWLSRQYEKFLIGQSRTFLLTALMLEGWNGSR